MKQASLSFVSKRPSNTADGKEKQAKSPAASAVGPSNAHPVIDLAESEIEDAGDTTPAPMEDVEQVSDGESDAAPAATSKRGAKAAATRKERGRKDDEDEIQDSEEEEQEQEPPKKKRRVAARSAKTKAAAVEIPDEEEAAPAKKGKGKRKGKQSLAKSVFRSREGAENSESTKEDWATESKKIKITVKGSGKGALAKHVNVEEMRRHFGYVREKMGNVKPSMYSPASTLHGCMRSILIIFSSPCRESIYGGPYPSLLRLVSSFRLRPTR